MSVLGIILAGGNGTRLSPMTQIISKQLLPIYNKPMIYYPLANLMLSDIKRYVIVVKSDQYHHYFNLLGNGSALGIEIDYVFQDQPKGIADAISLCDSYIEDQFVLALGDNFLYGAGLQCLFQDIIRSKKATIFGCNVKNPEAFGVAIVDKQGKLLEIREKEVEPASNLAVPGYYFLDRKAVEYASNINLSDRGEYEIADVLNAYARQDDLCLQVLGRGFLWYDTGTFKDLLTVSNFVQNTEETTQSRIGDVFEIAGRW